MARWSSLAGQRDKEAIMTTMVDRPETATEPRLESLERHNRSLRTTVAILAILAVAMGGWILFDFLGEAEVAATPEVAQLVDDYIQSWNDYDGDAFLALTSAGYRFESPGGMSFNQAEQAEEIVTTLPRFAWSVERLAEPVMTGDDPYYVTWPIKVTNNMREADGMSILTVVSDGDNFLVRRHVVIGDF